MLNVSDLRGIHARHLQHIGQLVQLFLAHLAFIDDDSIVKVSSFDEVGLQQWHDVAHKDKCPCGRYLRIEGCHVLKCGKLTVDELGVERTHGRETELIVGENRDDRPRVLVFDLYFMPNDVIIFCRILLDKTYFLDFFYIHGGRTVKDGELWSIDLYQTVVYARGIECRHSVFYRRDTDIAFGKNRSALRVNNVLSHGINDGLIFDIDALDFISCILRCRIEGHREVQSRVQSFPKERETSFQCCLLFSFHIL